MNLHATDIEIRMIPVEQVAVLNPRDRNARLFDGIISNIRDLGLKKPVTVTERANLGEGHHYLLICGEGRLKAFKALGQALIPARVVTATDEDAFIMSLTENIARRAYRPLELLAGIEQLQDKGYDKKTIAEKTGLSLDYVKGILQLLQKGEERLLVAVEAGKVPLNVAITITGAGTDDKAVQAALQDAYESGQLRGSQLMQARRIVERRQTLGRSIAHRPARKPPGVTSSSLVRNYQQEVERQRLLVRKAGFAQQRLLFVVEALRQLLSDEHFTNLLRAEGLETLPKQLADRVWSSAGLAS